MEIAVAGFRFPLGGILKLFRDPGRTPAEVLAALDAQNARNESIAPGGVPAQNDEVDRDEHPESAGRRERLAA